MKSLLQIVFLSVFAFGVSLADEEERKPKFTHKLAADFGVCPDGHKALQDVPIVYGHVGPLHKKPKDYNDEDRKLREKSDKGEIVFGGDCLDEYSPKFKVVCGQCGFRFHPSSMPVEFPELAFWAKDSKNAADFRIKFSERLLSLPLLNSPNGTVNYSQCLTADEKRLESESVSYTTAVGIEEVLKTIREWIVKAQGKPNELKREERAYAHHTYRYNEDGIAISIRDDTYWQPGKINVWLMLTHKDANKTQQDKPR